MNIFCWQPSAQWPCCEAQKVVYQKRQFSFGFLSALPPWLLGDPFWDFDHMPGFFSFASDDVCHFSFLIHHRSSKDYKWASFGLVFWMPHFIIISKLFAGNEKMNTVHIHARKVHFYFRNLNGLIFRRKCSTKSLICTPSFNITKTGKKYHPNEKEKAEDDHVPQCQCTV